MTTVIDPSTTLADIFIAHPDLAGELEAAAAKHFKVTRYGKIGGYPLWTLNAK